MPTVPVVVVMSSTDVIRFSRLKDSDSASVTVSVQSSNRAVSLLYRPVISVAPFDVLNRLNWLASL